MNNNINLDEIRKLANMIDVFANRLQQDVNQHCDELDKGRPWDLLPTGTPTGEDVVQVVRCKDCVHFEDAKVNAKGFLICPNTGMDIWGECYCAHGERTDNDSKEKGGKENMNNLEKRETLRWLRKMHEKFGQDIAVERKNGARLRFDDIIDDIIETVKGIPAAEDCHECKDCKYFETGKDCDGRRRFICTKFDEFLFDENEDQCLYGEKRIIDNDVAEQCPKCGNEVWLKWDVERDGYTIYCPYCGYRMKLCSMCDVRDGGTCDWNSDNETCKHDPIGIYGGD